MQDPDSLIPGRAPELSIVSQVTALRQQQESLFTTARERRADILAELAGLCGLLGALTRDEIPEGVLKRRRPAKKAARAPRAKKKTEEAAGAGA